MQYSQRDRAWLEREAAELAQQYRHLQQQELKLDLSRGKPGAEQLSLSLSMLDALDAGSVLTAEDGADCRNYGVPDGIPEARRLMGEILGAPADHVIVGGNSSLNLMHDMAGIGCVHGFPGGKGPWLRQDGVKFLCPSPGYDRHFALTEHFGLELIPVPMTAQGPDMDAVERLAGQDESVKGMWCVPKYSNPQGITYSDETVRRIARLRPAAGDFRVFWDDAYAVHDLYPGRGDRLLSLFEEMHRAGNPDIALLFTSTSKITFPGAGISAVAASAENLACIRKHLALQTIGYNKLNQLMHVRYLKDLGGVCAHMARHAAILAPKFEAVLGTLEDELGGLGIAEWHAPGGGYFISLDVPDGCAKRVVALCGEAGVVMTPAGATYPYGKDPRDRNIRIAPTFAAMDDLRAAAKLLCLCVRIAAVEALCGARGHQSA